MLAAGVTLLCAAGATAQSAPACAGQACPSAADLWTRAAQLHQFKNELVIAIRQLAEAVDGSFGDEGPVIVSGLDAVQRAVTRWDQEILAYETAFRPTAAASADVHLALGSVYLDRNRTDDAIREFTAAAQLTPARADIHTLAALAYDLENQTAKAAQALGAASMLAPDDEVIWYNLARHLTSIGPPAQAERAWQRFNAIQARPREDGAPAIQFDRANLLRQAAGFSPIFPPVLYAAGFRLLASGQYAAAITALRDAAAHDRLTTEGSRSPGAQAGAELRRGQLGVALTQLTAALDAAPGDSESRRVLGLAFWIDGQDDKSIEQLRAAVRLSPRDERSREGLAEVLLQSGREADAEASLKDALQTFPKSGRLHYRLAGVYQRQSLVPAALEQFEQAVAGDPLVGLDHLYETIGGLYADQANFDRAAAAYVSRTDVNPNNSEAHRKLGEVYFLQGRNDEALAQFTTSRLLNPKSADAYAASAQVYLRLERFAEAAAASRHAIALDPEHQKAHYTLATSLMRLGRTEEGQRELEAFQQMVEESTANARRNSELNGLERDAARSLGAGEYAAAAARLREALAYAPGLARLHFDLGVALTETGQTQAAIESFQRARDLEDGPEVHRRMAEAYRQLGRLDDSRTEDALHDQAVARAKGRRLRDLAKLP